ncbi:MAG: hypothetical protein NVS2B16_24340 [Chloroflexota bacterium]
MNATARDEHQPPGDERPDEKGGEQKRLGALQRVPPPPVDVGMLERLFKALEEIVV